jgi:hypothetical protein
MTTDHIVEEVRRVREQQAARHGFDIRAILVAARKRQRRSPLRVVSFAAKRRSRSRGLVQRPRRPTPDGVDDLPASADQGRVD